MRKLTLCNAFLLATLASMSAQAGWYTYIHNTKDNLTWHDSDGHVLDLHSSDASGVTITKLAPADLWGLRQDDAILAIDGHAIKNVDDVFAQLNAHNPASVQVKIRRGNAEKSLTLTEDEYRRILHPYP